MKITAGVILILVAVLNLFAAMGYMLGGALGTNVASLTEHVVESTEHDLDEAEIEEMRTGLEEIDDMNLAGSLFMIFGVLLLASVGVLIAAAVFLFKGSKAGFILVAGAYAIVLELSGVGVTKDLGVTNMIGLVGGVLAIIAALQIKRQLAAVADEHQVG